MTGSWGYQLGDGFVSGFETQEAARRHYGYRCSERAGDVVFVPADGEAAKAVRAERDRIAWLAEGMANKLHTMDADMVAGCLADLVAYLRSDK